MQWALLQIYLENPALHTQFDHEWLDAVLFWNRIAIVHQGSALQKVAAS